MGLGLGTAMAESLAPWQAKTVSPGTSLRFPKSLATPLGTGNAKGTPTTYNGRCSETLNCFSLPAFEFLLASQREPRTIAQHLPCSQNSYPAPQGPWISKAQFLSPQFICLLNKCLLRAYWAPDIVPGRGDGGSMHRMGEGTEGPS